MLYRFILLFLLSIFFTAGWLNAASCASPTATLNAGEEKKGQKIEKPYVDQDPGSGESLYYEITVKENGDLTLWTEKDGSDTVNTYAYLRDASCHIIDTAVVYASNPRLVRIDDKSLVAGTYYLQVENNVTTADVNDGNALGIFKLKTSFIKAALTHNISINKSAPSSVHSGAALTYTIDVSNNGSENTKTVTVTDTLPAHINYQGFSSSADWNCSASGQSVTCTLNGGVINAYGGVKRVEIHTQADYMAADTPTDNSATADVTYNTSGNIQVSDTQSVTILKAQPGITLSKKTVASGTQTPQSDVLQNQTFDYLLQVQNNSQLADQHVVLADDVPGSFTVTGIEDTANVWDCNSSSGQHVECSLKSDLAVGASEVLRIHVSASGAVADAIVNNAKVAADTLLGASTATASATASMNIVAEKYAVDFSKINPDTSIIIGENTTYTLKVTNQSNVALSGIKIVDTLPHELNVSAINESGWSCQPIVSNTVACTLDSSLSVGSSASLDIIATAVGSGSGIINTATLSSSTITEKNASKSIDILATAPSDLTISKNASEDIVLENDSFDYIISVHNSGKGMENNLTITDDIPADFSVDSNITEGSWNCLLSDHHLSCALSSLASGQSADDIIIQVTAPSHIAADKSVTNSAKVTSNKETTGKTAQKVVTLRTASNAIKVHLQSTPDTLYQGEDFVYSLFITNNSAKTTSNVTVSDILPSDLILRSIDSGGWHCDYNTTNRVISCDTNGAQLTAGDKQIDFYVTAPNYEVNITDKATVITDIDPLVREANVTTTVLKKENVLAFTQSDASQDPVGVNQSFHYTLKVKNVNTGYVQNKLDATDVRVDIALDPTLHYLSHSAAGWDCNVSGGHLGCILQSALAVGAESAPIMIDVNTTAQAYTITDFNLSCAQSSVPVLKSIPVDVFNSMTGNLALSLRDNKDPVEAKQDYTYMINVSNSGTNETVHDVLVHMETVSMDNFVLKGITGTDWNCSQSGTQVNCHLGTLAANATSVLTLNVTAPDINDTVEVNATVSSSLVHDNNLLDNSADETTQVIQYHYNSDNLRDFTQVLINGNTNTNIYGDVWTIGNQAMCEKDASGMCQEPSYKVNDWVYQTQVNADGSTLGNATSANLDIDPNDEVIWAGLYWMGMIDRNAGDSAKIEQAKYVRLRHNSESSYIKVTSQVDKLNWKNDNSFGKSIFGYQGMADVTAYVKAHKKGAYWVGDIQTTEGYNLSAGWSLVVVVQDKTQTKDLRNVTLFDGFKSVWKNSAYTEANLYPDFVNATVSGFLTPSGGPVNSKLSLFGLEGDETLKDSISITDENNVSSFLSNALNPQDDVVNGTVSTNGVSNAARNPALSNTSGVDIDTFDVSSIIGNAQSATTIKIASEGDRFYLGMFAFSTELYLPKMCYVEMMTKPDYTPLDNNRVFNLGDEIGFDVSIRNDENETAHKVELKSEIDLIYRETNGTAEIKNVGESTFTKHQELWSSQEVNATNDKNETMPQTIFTARVGSGANSTQGGDMGNKDTVHFRYHGIVDSIPDVNLTRNVYKVSYQIDNMPDVLDTTIKPCDPDLNQTIYVKPNFTTGFEITHPGGISDGLDDDSGNENHLYTQVSDHPFDVDIVALENDFSTARVHKGVIRLDLVKLDGSECKSYPAVASDYMAINDLSRFTTTRSYHDVNKQFAFRIVYPVDRYQRYASWNGIDTENLSDLQAMLIHSYGSENSCKTACSSNLQSCRECIFDPANQISKVSCSGDDFAIRPAAIMIEANATTLLGGKDYNLSFDANATGYDQQYPINTVERSVRRILKKPAGCTIADLNETVLSAPLLFSDGNASISDFRYENVGDINVSIVDSLWTAADQNLSNSTMSDCIVGSSSNIAVGGKYGCNIHSASLFTFLPGHFQNTVQLQNDLNATFSYLDNSGERGAHAYMKVNALLADDTLATNYTAGCFAKDIDYILTLNASPTSLGTIFTAETGTDLVSAALHSFHTTEGNFTNGIAKPVVGINFARTKTSAENPFDINSSQLGITVADDDFVSGNGFDTPIGAARFYYARLYAPDYLSIEPSTFRSGLFYEVYCNTASGCHKNSMGLGSLHESEDHVNWYVFNALHNDAALGGYDPASVKSAGILNINATAPKYIDIALPASAKRPYCDNVSFKPDAWFKYDEFSPAQAERTSFKTCFFSESAWSGEGNIGKIIDTNIAKRKNSKIDW